MLSVLQVSWAYRRNVKKEKREGRVQPKVREKVVYTDAQQIKSNFSVCFFFLINYILNGQQYNQPIDQPTNN